ncbi:hypothetical protein Droror1_Dr00010245 [Drosera rotundifolia]
MTHEQGPLSITFSRLQIFLLTFSPSHLLTASHNEFESLISAQLRGLSSPSLSHSLQCTNLNPQLPHILSHKFSKPPKRIRPSQHQSFDSLCALLFIDFTGHNEGIEDWNFRVLGKNWGFWATLKRLRMNWGFWVFLILSNTKLGVRGFNMGGAMALYSATCFAFGKYGNGNQYPINLRAVVALSGWLPGSRIC